MNLAEMVFRRASAYPDSPALHFRNRVITYNELVEQTLAAAAWFVAQGVGAGDRVALIVRNCPEFVISYLALARIGGVSVPLNPAMSARELADALTNFGVIGVIAQQFSLETVRTAMLHSPDVEFMVVVDKEPNTRTEVAFESLLNAPLNTTLDEGPSGDDLLTLLFTSGTTGQCKGVMLSHANVVSNAEGIADALGQSATECCMAVLPMFHSFCWTTSVISPLLLGAPVVVQESVQPFSGVLENIARYQVNVFMAVPPIFAALVKAPPGKTEECIRSLRFGVTGGAPLPAGLQTAFEKRFNIPLFQGYGLTEASPVLTVNPRNGTRKTGSVGRPLKNIQVQVRDADGCLAPPGEVGEVVATGENIMQGYWRNPSATAEVFTPDGWLRTGDLGYLDKGNYLFLVGRQKDLIIVKGLNVYPIEVEELLARHPAVAEAAVVGFPDPTGDEIIKAFVTLKEGEFVTPQEILNILNGNLAAYKVPRDLRIIEEMPKNMLGKILKPELRRMALENGLIDGVDSETILADTSLISRNAPFGGNPLS